MDTVKLNELQIPTWHWLGVNSMDVKMVQGHRAYLNRVMDGALEGGMFGQGKAVPKIDGLPKDFRNMLKFVRGNKNHSLHLTIPEGIHLKNPVIFEFMLDKDSPQLINYIHIKAMERSSADVVVVYRSAGDKEYSHTGFTRLEAACGASVRLIKVQLLSDKDVHTDLISSAVALNAQVQVFTCELGGKKAVSGCNIVLEGENSRGRLEGLYTGGGSSHKDLSYTMKMKGKGSQGEILVRGALSGHAKKVLKSTLDFCPGCSGAKGREDEQILSLSDTSVNLSLPLLLCGEERVEGEHATATGKPDADKLYYLMSRGFSEKEATRLMIEASFNPVINKLPGEELKEEIQRHIQGVVNDV